jgi:hypothetical protein
MVGKATRIVSKRVTPPPKQRTTFYPAHLLLCRLGQVLQCGPGGDPAAGHKVAHTNTVRLMSPHQGMLAAPASAVVRRMLLDAHSGAAACKTWHIERTPGRCCLEAWHSMNTTQPSQRTEEKGQDNWQPANAARRLMHNICVTCLNA